MYPKHGAVETLFEGCTLYQLAECPCVLPWVRGKEVQMPKKVCATFVVKFLNGVIHSQYPRHTQYQSINTPSYAINTPSQCMQLWCSLLILLYLAPCRPISLPPNVVELIDTMLGAPKLVSSFVPQAWTHSHLFRGTGLFTSTSHVVFMDDERTLYSIDPKGAVVCEPRSDDTLTRVVTREGLVLELCKGRRLFSYTLGQPRPTTPHEYLIPWEADGIDETSIMGAFCVGGKRVCVMFDEGLEGDDVWDFPRVAVIGEKGTSAYGNLLWSVGLQRRIKVGSTCMPVGFDDGTIVSINETSDVVIGEITADSCVRPVEAVLTFPDTTVVGMWEVENALTKLVAVLDDAGNMRIVDVTNGCVTLHLEGFEDMVNRSLSVSSLTKGRTLFFSPPQTAADRVHQAAVCIIARDGGYERVVRPCVADGLGGMQFMGSIKTLVALGRDRLLIAGSRSSRWHIISI